MLSTASAAGCTIALAGLRVAIVCENAVITAALRDRYHQFLTDQIADVVAHIRLVEGTATTSLLDAQIDFRDGTAHFTTPGYVGSIDVAHGQAQLVIAATQPLDAIEYFVRVIYALLAFEAGGLLFHAAGIVRRDRAYLFFGYSGSGKTTVARCSPHDQVLNDDLVLLMPQRNQWIAYATPFWNPTQVQPGGSSAAPLAALLRLVQAKHVALESIGAGYALAELVANAPIIAADPDRSARLFERCSRLAQAVPCRRLHFLPDPSFWPVVETLAVP